MKRLGAFAFSVSAIACGCTGGNPATDAGVSPGQDASAIPVPVDAGEGAMLASSIRHLVVVVQENHSFDSYFATLCAAAPGSAPTCTSGPSCCEAGPSKNPGSDAPPVTLDDTTNAAFSPNHTQSCENSEINGGKMDSYVTASPLVTCGNPLNFAYASAAANPYRDYAGAGALADHWFQPVTGQSGSNLIYFGTARFQFVNNSIEPDAIGANCEINPGAMRTSLNARTVFDLLDQAGVSWAWYAEGYAATKAANGGCPSPPSDCPSPAPELNPCTYAPSSIVPAYFKATADNPVVMRDLNDLFTNLTANDLPSVVFVRGLDYHTEHPGFGITISAGTTFVKRVVDAVNASPVAGSTLVLLVFDESGGYFDHVPPPAASTVDKQPYGARVPAIALGPFARKNFISHVVLEHSSVVRFIEWNWLGGTGQLNGRDAVVNNIGSLLDPSTTGVPVPSETGVVSP